MKMEIFLLQDNGDVPDAICPRTFFPLHTPAGAQRKSTPRQFRDYRLIRAVKPVATPESYQKSVLILASCYVMLVRVLPVHIWVLVKFAFAVRGRLRGDAWKQITTRAGAAERYAGISCHAVSIPAKNHVMRVCAALARSLWTAAATAVRTSE